MKEEPAVPSVPPFLPMPSMPPAQPAPPAAHSPATPPSAPAPKAGPADLDGPASLDRPATPPPASLDGPATPPPATPPVAPIPLALSADDGEDEPFDTEAFFNPYCGPPDGEDTWLADVAAELAAEYLDAREAKASSPAAERDALAAGFTHCDRGPGAQGFAAGGPLDQMEPGPVLAGFTEDAIGAGLSALGDDELIGVLCAARRLASWAGGVELAAVADLDSRRAAHAAATGDSRQAKHVGDEVAAALTLTCRAADRLVSLAAGVARLPAVTAALAAGRIDMPRAIVFADELAALDDITAAAIAALIAPDAPALTTSRLRDVLHRTVLTFDPDNARKRREKAQKDARVECWAEPSGTWALAGRDMPPAEVLAADKHVDAAARALKAAGAEGTLEHLRARVFLTLLSGQPLYTLLPGNETPAGGSPAEGPEESDSGGGDDPGWPGPGNGGTRRPRPGGQPGGPHGGQAFPQSLTGSVSLVVPLATWLGLTEQPGEAIGQGPLDAATCRDLANAIAAGPGSRWCLTITGPGGQAIGHGCARAGPGPPASGGPGSPRWLAGIRIRWLQTGACGHARETFAYQPSAVLRHLIKTRDRTCCYPGCRRPARRCDDDHTLPYDQGGRTCECNLAPLCRRHHAAKQAPGWHLKQPQPGTLIWTLPSGRAYSVTPRPY